MKSRVYDLVIRHYFFLTTTLIVASIYSAIGHFALGMTGYLIGATVVSLTTRGIGIK